MAELCLKAVLPVSLTATLRQVQVGPLLWTFMKVNTTAHMGFPQHLHLHWFGSNLRNNYDLLSSKWGIVRTVLMGKPSWATQETTGGGDRCQSPSVKWGWQLGSSLSVNLSNQCG